MRVFVGKLGLVDKLDWQSDIQTACGIQKSIAMIMLDPNSYRPLLQILSNNQHLTLQNQFVVFQFFMQKCTDTGTAFNAQAVLRIQVCVLCRGVTSRTAAHVEDHGIP